jgi:NAD(P)-dependent dehydrogenase (short-subunit alcohol dehydrogenase family)
VNRLDGRVVLITGSAERAGREFAIRYAETGAIVAVNHVDGQQDSAASVVDHIVAGGGRAQAFAADITRADESRRLVADCVAAFGRLDVLVHNASTFRPSPWLEVTEADFDASFGVNVRGPFFLSQAAAAVMLEQGEGRIIALLGNSLVEAWPDFMPHGLAKTALARLMEQLAVALAPVVSCNSVAPTQFLRSDDHVNDELRRARGEAVAAGGTVELAPGIRVRETDVDAVFEALLYYSTCAPQVTGTHLRIDGGRSLI